MKNTYWKYEDVAKIADAVVTYKGNVPHNERRSLAKELDRSKFSISTMSSQIKGFFGYSEGERKYLYQSKNVKQMFERYADEHGLSSKNYTPSTALPFKPTNGIEQRLQRLNTLYTDLQSAIVDVSMEIAKYQAQKEVDTLRAELEETKKVVDLAKKTNLIDMLKKRMTSNF